MSLAPGQMLSHYRLVEKIGEGGMGEVWKAVDTTLDREVAVKVLPDAFADDPERIRRFEREARILATLDHPGIVTVHSVERVEGRRLITMELVRGTPLARRIPERGMPLAEFFRLSIDVADALVAAHDQGVTHRDLKPANVMLGDDGRVKVLDFGLSKLFRADSPTSDSKSPTATGTLTEAGCLLGTVPYVSPEQLRGKSVDQRADLFSFGVMMYEMVAGRRPFRGDSVPELMSAILATSPPSATEVRPGLPHHLGRIIRRCLEKEPDRRYQSALDVRNELVDLRQESSSADPAAQPVRRRTGLAWAAVLALLVVISGLGIAMRNGWFGTRSGPPPGPPGIRSLAVLPLLNLMDDPDQDYFVEGMHEALITDLAMIHPLRVISRSSAMRYKGSDKPIRTIAEELDVDAVVEGSVLRADGQVRISVQLIDGQTDGNLWARNYDRKVENTLALLSEVARTIAAEIRIELTPRQQQILADPGSVSPEAQDALMRGRYHLNRGGLRPIREARDHFQRATEIEPLLAAAWSGVAGCDLILGFFGMEPIDASIPRARQNASHALKLDEKDGGAHSVLGYVALFFDWEFEIARRELELAIELDPNNPFTYHAYADYLGVTGDPDEALRQIRLGWYTDPLGYWANMVLLGHLFMAREYDEVVEQAPRALELFPESTAIRGFITAALWELGRDEEALAQCRLARGADSEFVRDLERGYAEGGRRGAMRARADRLAGRPNLPPMSAHDVARYYALAEEPDLAFEWLERAFEERNPKLLHVPMDPRFDCLRDDPRYRDLFHRRIGLPG